MNGKSKDWTSLKLYGFASEQAADQIIRAYSTSFGAATKLLGVRHRQHVRNIYALVRIADELVDGVAAEANLNVAEQAERLDALEAQTEDAMNCGYSSNPIVHAFAITARLSRIDTSLTAPFFASMRMDLALETNKSSAPGTENLIRFDDAAHANYVYGSAEVVGLMCLKVFVRDQNLSEHQYKVLERGARSLGAAFQNVNFMRDLADDTERLARSYLSDGQPITEELKEQWIETISTQLADAERVLPLLPQDARVAVDCARRLFSRLNDKLAETPVKQLLEKRVRVSNPEKAILIAQSISAARKKDAK